MSAICCSASLVPGISRRSMIAVVIGTASEPPWSSATVMVKVSDFCVAVASSLAAAWRACAVGV